MVAAEKTGPEQAAPPRIPALLAQYRQEVRPTLMEEFGYPNPLAVPYLEKVVLNIGLGEALQKPRALESAANDLATITGQRPVITRAHKSVAEFKVRKGMAIGTSVTLRAHKMYDFLQRLVNTTLARIRDFRGVSRSSFDGTGNYSLGLREQLVFGKDQDIAETIEILIPPAFEPKRLCAPFHNQGRRIGGKLSRLASRIDSEFGLTFGFEKDIRDQDSDVQAVQQTISKGDRNHVGREGNVVEIQLGHRG